jgi:leucyl aminopeptidase
MSESEKKQMRNITVADMFNTSRSVQAQLLEAAKFVSVADFLFSWHCMLPERQHLT